MVSPGVHKLVDKLPTVERAIKYLAETRVMAGIPSTKDPRERTGPIGNAALGYIHDNGAPEVNIPARPWRMPGVRRAQAKILGYLKQAGKAALAGSQIGAGRAFEAAGLAAQNGMREVINQGVPPPLAESTLRSRRRRGRTGEVPLIDTTQLRNAISYVVRKVKRK